MAAARGGPAEPEAGSDGGGEEEEKAKAAAEAPGRAQVFNTVVDAFLEKLVAVGSYQRFASCYRCFYRLQPEMTRSIYEQFVSQLQASVKEEIREVKEEGNLDVLFNSLDKIVEEAKNQEEPAWSYIYISSVEVSAAETREEINSVLDNPEGQRRPSGIPEEDIRSAVVPYLLKHRSYLHKVLKEKEELNRSVAQSVLTGRNRIAELQQLIQARRHTWQAFGKEQGELLMTFKEPQ